MAAPETSNAAAERMCTASLSWASKSAENHGGGLSGAHLITIIHIYHEYWSYLINLMCQQISTPQEAQQSYLPPMSMDLG